MLIFTMMTIMLIIDNDNDDNFDDHAVSMLTITLMIIVILLKKIKWDSEVVRQDSLSRHFFPRLAMSHKYHSLPL